jgi:hypothetical protein
MGTRPLRAPVLCGWHPLRCLRHHPAGAWHPGAVPLSLRLFSTSSLALLPGSLVLACSYRSFVLLPTLGPTFGPHTSCSGTLGAPSVSKELQVCPRSSKCALAHLGAALAHQHLNQLHRLLLRDLVFFPLTNSCAMPRGAATSQVHGVTIGSLPANAVSYYESGDVSVIFSIPTVSFCMGQGDEDHVGDGSRLAWPALRVRVPCVAAPPTRGRDRAPALRICARITHVPKLNEIEA